MAIDVYPEKIKIYSEYCRLPHVIEYKRIEFSFSDCRESVMYRIVDIIVEEVLKMLYNENLETIDFQRIKEITGESILYSVLKYIKEVEISIIVSNVEDRNDFITLSEKVFNRYGIRHTDEKVSRGVRFILEGDLLFMLFCINLIMLVERDYIPIKNILSAEDEDSMLKGLFPRGESQKLSQLISDRCLVRRVYEEAFVRTLSGPISAMKDNYLEKPKDPSYSPWEVHIILQEYENHDTTN